MSSKRAAVDRNVIAAVAIAVILLMGTFLALRKSPPPTKPTAQMTPVMEPNAREASPSMLKSGSSGSPFDLLRAQAAAVSAPPLEDPFPKTPVESNLHGTVIDADTMAPIPGVKVSVSAGLLDNVVEAPVVVVFTLSDAQGAWNLPIHQQSNGGRNFRLIASAEGYATTAMPFEIKDGEKDRTMEIVLRKAGTLAGHVVDEEGAGIEGVGLTASVLGDNFPRGENQPFSFLLSWTRSGPGGAFEFTNAPATGEIRLEARKEGFVSELLENVKPGDQNVTVVLTSGGGTINGLVVDANEKPQPGITVTGTRLLEGRQAGTAETRITDAEGRFVMEGLHEGTWRLGVRTKPVAGGSGFSAGESVKLKPNESTDVTIRLPAIKKITGRVVDVAATDNGIPGVTVSTSPLLLPDFRRSRVVRNKNITRQVVTDAAGAFSIEVPDNRPNLSVMPPAGWAELPNSPVLVTKKEFEDQKPLLIKLKRVPFLKGKVVDGNDAPASEVGIVIFGRRQTISGDDGLFQISIPESGDFKITAQSDEGWDQQAFTAPLSNPDDVFVFKLKAYATISGKVLTSAGASVPGVYVDVQYSKNSSVSIPGGAGKGDTNEAGYYFKEGLLAGTVYVNIQLPTGSEYAPPGTKIIELNDGERKENVNFVVGDSEFIEGTVTNVEGNFVKDAVIEYSSYSQSSLPTFTRRTLIKSDEKGYYRIPGLVGGQVSYMLSIRHEDYASQQRSAVTTLDGVQNFVLKKRPKISLVVQEEEGGAPIPHYNYVFGEIDDLSRSDGNGGHVDDAGGRTTIVSENSEAQNISAEQTTAGGEKTGRKGTARFTPGEGEQQTEVTIYLMKADYHIAGRVIHELTKLPVPDAELGFDQVTSKWGSDVMSKRASSDEDGRFRFDGLPAGEYVVSAEMNGGVGKANFEIGSKDSPSVDDAEILLSPAARVHGNVIGRDGKPAGNAKVSYAESINGREKFRFTDASGNYTIDDASGGQWRIAADLDGAIKTETISVRSGEDTEVNFDFSKSIHLTGALMINGAPMPEDSMAGMYLRGATGGASILLKRTANGYEVSADPGAYDVVYTETNIWIVSRIEIPPAPTEQHRDINAVLLEADVVIDMGEGVEFKGGSIGITGGTPYPPQSIQIQTSRKHISKISAGAHTAAFNSFDGLYRGESQPVTITAGGENVFYIPVTKKAQ